MRTGSAERTGVMCMMKTAGRQTRPMRGSSTAKPTSSPCRTCRTCTHNVWRACNTSDQPPVCEATSVCNRLLVLPALISEKGLPMRSPCITGVEAHHEQCLEGVGVFVTDGELDAQPVAWHPHGSADHGRNVLPTETDTILTAVGSGYDTSACFTVSLQTCTCQVPSSKHWGTPHR
jgi:hypothetical protein